MVSHDSYYKECVMANVLSGLYRQVRAAAVREQDPKAL